MRTIRQEVERVARTHRLPVSDVLELYDGFRSTGMQPLDAAVKALAITSVVSGNDPIVDGLESERN